MILWTKAINILDGLELLKTRMTILCNLHAFESAIDACLLADTFVGH